MDTSFRNDLAKRFSPFPFHHQQPIKAIEKGGTSGEKEKAPAQTQTEGEEEEESEWDKLETDMRTLDSFSMFKWLADRIPTHLIFKNQLVSMFENRSTVDRELVRPFPSL